MGLILQESGWEQGKANLATTGPALQTTEIKYCYCLQLVWNEVQIVPISFLPPSLGRLLPVERDLLVINRTNFWGEEETVGTGEVG